MKGNPFARLTGKIRARTAMSPIQNNATTAMNLSQNTPCDKKFTILVDMDDTIEYLLREWLNWLNAKHGRNVSESDIKEWNIRAAYPGLTEEECYEPLFHNKLWQSIKPMPDAVKWLKQLYEDGHDIYIVTSSNFHTIEAKLDSILFSNFPFIRYDHVIVCRNKQMIRGDIMIDDGPHNLIGGDYIKILMTAAHNRDFDAEANGMIRVHCWGEIYGIISELSQESAE